jgi:hypothetical protein
MFRHHVVAVSLALAAGSAALAQARSPAETLADIRDGVSAEFEPIAVADVAAYLDLLATAGAITYR